MDYRDLSARQDNDNDHHLPRKKLAKPRRTLFKTDSAGLPTALLPWELPSVVLTT